MSKEAEFTTSACIFHPRLMAAKVYHVHDKVKNNWLRYGLCPMCNGLLKRQDSFKKLISEKLAELEDKLQKQEEKKRGSRDFKRG